MPVLPLVMAGVGLASKAYGMYEANKREKEAKRQLAELAKTPYAKYSVNPLVKRYTDMGMRDIQSPQGFTGAEAADFQSRIAAAQNAARQNAISLGGSSVSRAVGGALGASNLAAQNQFAAQNAALARQNRNLGFSRFMQGASVAQSVQDRNTQNELNRRMMTEQAFGAAARQAGDQQRAMISGLGSDLIGGAFNMYAMDKYYGGDKTGMGANPTAQARYGMSNRQVGNLMEDAESVQAQQNAMAKGFSGMPSETYGFYNDPRVPKLNTRPLTVPRMPVRTFVRK